jgi:CBS-domain-containing membrane protein
MNDLTQRFERLVSKAPSASLAPSRTLGKQQTQKGKRDEFVEERKGRRPRPLRLDVRFKLLQNPPSTLKEVLSKYCLQEIALLHWMQKRPILVGDYQTIERALSRINAHEIKSLPVVDKNKIVIGVIDIMDITKSIVDAINTHGVSEITTPYQGKVRSDFMTKSVGSLLAERKKPTYVASNELSLLVATQYLVSTGQERFMIVDRKVPTDVAKQTQPEELLDGILTQSDVVKFLAQNTVLLRQEPVFQKTLRELNLGERKPLIFHHKEITSKAYITMAEKEISSAAVVDDEGVLIDNISVSDLKGLNRRNCVVLSSALEEFLRRDWKRGWWLKPICVQPSDTLFFVILQFVSSSVHNMYLVDRDEKPIGEVSLEDVLKVLITI